MADRVQVKNAADPQQVERASRRERRWSAEFMTAIRQVLDTHAGRRMCWELLARAGVYRSVWDNSARIHYNAGRQDFGHELVALFLEADETLYELMEREARARAKADNRETDAGHTPPATPEGDER